MVGWKKKKKYILPLLGHQLESCFVYCGHGFPVLCFSGDPDMKQNGKLFTFSLGPASRGSEEGVKNSCLLTACSRQVFLNILALAAFDISNDIVCYLLYVKLHLNMEKKYLFSPH